MTKKLRSKVNYLVHELNSGTYLVKYYVKKLREKYPDITETDIEGIFKGLKVINDIEDHFYNWAKEQEDWNDPER